jgi:hypothetical protein
MTALEHLTDADFERWRRGPEADAIRAGGWPPRDCERHASDVRHGRVALPSLTEAGMRRLLEEQDKLAAGWNARAVAKLVEASGLWPIDAKKAVACEDEAAKANAEATECLRRVAHLTAKLESATPATLAAAE